MPVVTEDIVYADFVKPVRRGFRWLVLYFAITLSAAACFLSADDFIIAAVLIVFPGSVLPFVSPWSRARQLAKQTKAVTIAESAIIVDDSSHDLSQCRWFRGFAFHDPKLAEYPASEPAIVISWPPFGNEDRTICGLTAAVEEQIAQRLKNEAVPQDKPRRVNERFLLNASTLGAAMLVIAFMSGVNLVAVPAIPFPSVLTSAAVGGITIRVLLKQKFGHLQCQGPSFGRFTAWFTLIVVATLKMNRGNPGGPLLQDPAWFMWVLPLVLVQGACLFALYRYVRAREDKLLEIHADHTVQDT